MNSFFLLKKLKIFDVEGLSTYIFNNC